MKQNLRWLALSVALAVSAGIVLLLHTVPAPAFEAAPFCFAPTGWPIGFFAFPFIFMVIMMTCMFLLRRVKCGRRF